MEKIKVLVADDHLLVREGICKLLELDEKITIVGEAVDGEDVVNKAKELKPDLILMDLNMPKLSGVQASKQIKSLFPEIKIIILTIHDDEEYVYEVLKAGAEGYLQKDVSAEELRSALQMVFNGETLFPASVINRVMGRERSKGKIGESIEDILTEREIEVLEMMAKGNNNRAIGEKLFISEKTVKNHVSNILKKLGVNDRTQAVIYAIKKGWVDIK
ncbi:DNA-binding response regulator [Anoxybacter fermentans]|uniref:Stage 0 sporulation protein A homolog n=1 Tax=Anoxybacter fermentans TaxID=1323375 RepID=A0A3S9T329_9FIRM|nr:response regulator transcription factor [Anoxybacter fermentans]AZR74945.1 DNA-binding response regulator [Anoxybacter fermentans]